MPPHMTEHRNKQQVDLEFRKIWEKLDKQHGDIVNITELVEGDGTDPGGGVDPDLIGVVRTWRVVVDLFGNFPVGYSTRLWEAVATIEAEAYTHLDVQVVVLQQGVHPINVQLGNYYDFDFRLGGVRTIQSPYKIAGTYRDITATSWFLAKWNFLERGLHDIDPNPYEDAGEPIYANAMMGWPMNNIPEHAGNKEQLQLFLEMRNPPRFKPDYTHSTICYKAFVTGRYVEHPTRLFLNAGCPNG